jgi:hypothetical protein
VQAVQSDRVKEEVGDSATGSGTMIGTPPAVSRPKAWSPGDGVGDGVALREAAKAPREAVLMALREVAAASREAVT